MQVTLVFNFIFTIFLLLTICYSFFILSKIDSIKLKEYLSLMLKNPSEFKKHKLDIADSERKKLKKRLMLLGILLFISILAAAVTSYRMKLETECLVARGSDCL